MTMNRVTIGIGVFLVGVLWMIDNWRGDDVLLAVLFFGLATLLWNK